MTWRDAITACFRPTVNGRPRWLAQYLAQGLCRIKWLSAAGIIAWIVQAGALSRGPTRQIYQPAAERLGVAEATLIGTSVAIGIAGAVIVLLSGRSGMTVSRARGLVLAVALTTVTSESLLFGLSHISLERVASLDLDLLLVLAIMPLGLLAAVFIFIASQVVVFGSALLAGQMLGAEQLPFFVHPLSFAALGFVANRWYIGAFKGEQLGQLRLQRHMREVQGQKRLIEAQKDEALQQ